MQIHLGYEIESGEPVGISPSHIIVTGVTQLSGKCLTGGDEVLLKSGEIKTVREIFESGRTSPQKWKRSWPM